jgi:hypothetical protein
MQDAYLKIENYLAEFKGGLGRKLEGSTMTEALYFKTLFSLTAEKCCG